LLLILDLLLRQQRLLNLLGLLVGIKWRLH
jgi:hypothetical protein